LDSFILIILLISLAALYGEASISNLLYASATLDHALKRQPTTPPLWKGGPSRKIKNQAHQQRKQLFNLFFSKCVLLFNYFDFKTPFLSPVKTLNQQGKKLSFLCTCSNTCLETDDFKTIATVIATAMATTAAISRILQMKKLT